MRVTIKNVRGSYVHIDEPFKSEFDREGKYSMTCLLPKEDAQLKQLHGVAVKLARERWPNVDAATLTLPLRDGDTKGQEAYEGCVYFNARSSRRPGIITKAKQRAEVSDIETDCYSGAYFHVSVNLYTYDVSGNRGVGVGLNNVMLTGRGDPLDGRRSAEADFADVDAEVSGGDTEFTESDGDFPFPVE